MSCTNTTNMYLSISTQICASGSASRSGNTVTVSGTLSVSQSGSWNTNAIYGYVDGVTTWQKVKNAGNVSSGSANFSFSFQSSSAGSATYSAVFQVWNSAETGPVGGAASTTFSVSWPASGSAPSNGYINGLTSTYNGTEIQFYASSVGVNDGGLALDLNRFQICEVPFTGGGLDSQMVNFTNGQPVTLTQSNSTPNYGGVTIVGNHLYYFGLTARNSVGRYYYNGPSIVSPCVPATFSFEPIDSHSVSISYATVADGGYYSKTLEYSLDGEHWNTGATVLSGAASSGTFTISSLDSYKYYTIQFRVTTSVGSTDSGGISFVLLRNKFYGSVNSLTEKTNKLYGSLSNQSKTIVKLYASENGRAKLIYKEKK